MASACVNNFGVPSENYIGCAPADFPAYGWLTPRISLSREYADEDSTLFSAGAAAKQRPTAVEASDPPKDVADFEFRLDDPVTMLPADELFSDGKLIPLQLTEVRPTSMAPVAGKSLRGNEVAYLFSPKAAPRCANRWRDLLGLKKLYQNSNKATSSSSSASTTTTSSFSSTHSSKSIRQFLLRNSKSFSEPQSDASLNLPLLKDADCESVSVSSSRLSSLSSSSSGHDFEDLPRLSMDSESKNSQSHKPPSRNSNHSLVHPRARIVKQRMIPVSSAENPKPLIDHPSAPTPVSRARRSSIRCAQQDPAAVTSGISVDSPRMSSSGKIVFQGLERSSSSPSSFNGGPRYKHRGMERSYSTNVRVTKVLNVPVCSSLRGASKSGVFGLFSCHSQSQKKEANTSGNSRGHHPTTTTVLPGRGRRASRDG